MPRSRRCQCSPIEAVEWIDRVLLSALDGDDSATGMLADAIEHWLAVVRRVEAAR